MKRYTSLLMISLFSTFAFAEKNESSTFPNLRATYTRAEYQPHAGLLVGLVNPNEGDTSTEFGLDVGYQPYIPFGLGIELTRTEDRSILLGKGSYHFGGVIPIIHTAFVGVAAGHDDAIFVAGPLAGFDIPLSEYDPGSHISLGGSAKYLFSSNSDAQSLSVNGTMKYWF